MPDLWLDVDVGLAEVPVNIMPLLDSTDFIAREESVVFDQSGLDLVWNFVTTAGAMTQTAVTPTDTAGVYDWVSQGNGMYSIEIPASGGASINNDTEGFGWFTGFATGILPWRGPVIGFRAAGLNNVLIDDAHSVTRGLAGTALPAAAADAIGGLPISDAGGLDLDAKLAATNEVTAARMAALTDWIDGNRLDLILDIIAADVVNLDGSSMVGTDNAALAADLLDKLGAVNEAAAAGDPSATESVMQYVKQIVNVLVGTDGIGTWPSEQAPANAVNIAEVLRAIHADTGTTLDGKLPSALVGGRIDATIDGTGMETGAMDAILQRQITEAYNADGTAPTVEQALMGILQGLTEFAISSTTLTVKKLDGSTTAMTFTLDDATNPTSRTRAT